MSETNPKDVLAALWRDAGHAEAALAYAELSGADPVLPSSFAIGTAAQASIAGAARACAWTCAALPSNSAASATCFWTASLVQNITTRSPGSIAAAMAAGCGFIQICRIIATAPLPCLAVATIGRRFDVHSMDGAVKHSNRRPRMPAS